MTQEIKCSDLGLLDCDTVFRGETPGDMVGQAAKHMRSVHGISLPGVEVIFEGLTAAALMEGEIDRDARLVVRRLRKKLDIDPATWPAVH